ncbi:MAG: nickel-dependent lactate racemase [Candidatus Hydrogenedens sp.]|nr:nickel-dependent lactate racemase [Candidatus Hydrogenedens sp.]
MTKNTNSKIININIQYLNQFYKISLPQQGYIGTYNLSLPQAEKNICKIFNDVIQNPIGNIENIKHKNLSNKKISIVISDTFRYTGVEQFLSLLLEILFSSGCQSKNIQFLVSAGSHRPPTESELSKIVTEEIFNQFKQQIIIPDPSDLKQYQHLGKTTRGTPVYVHQEVMSSDYLILTGTILFHYFAGFGGGRKSIVPGLSALPTIQHNHALSIHPERCEIHPQVKIGVMEGNPVAEDLIEATFMTQKEYLIINTVLSPQKNIIKIFCGDLIHAHETGANFAKHIYSINIPQQADIVIASAGDAKNFLQSHKALVNAWQARKQPHGKIIFIAPCPEGLGGHKFKEWLEIGDTNKLLSTLRKNGEVNGQTIISTLEKSQHTYFLTELPESTVLLMGGRKISTLEEGFNLAWEELKKQGIKEPTWMFLPDSAYSVPII